jgi:hypothetical protein
MIYHAVTVDLKLWELQHIESTTGYPPNKSEYLKIQFSNLKILTFWEKCRLQL